MNDIKYDDNLDVLELIEGGRGIIPQLIEECLLPRGSPNAFLPMFVYSNNKKKLCLKMKKTFGNLGFGIVHYTCSVLYTAHDFVICNMDSLPEALYAVAKTCTNGLLS
jgi:myosin heavy subunit